MRVEEVISDGVWQKMRSDEVDKESDKKESYEKEIEIVTAAGLRPAVFLLQLYCLGAWC